MPFSSIAHRLLKVRPRRGGGLASYFGGDLSALEPSALDSLSGVGVSGRSGYLAATDTLDAFSAAGSAAGSSSNLGQVGPFSSLNLALHPIYSVNMALADYAMYDNTGGSYSAGSHSSSGWWDGGAYRRMYPPTIAGRSIGIGLWDLWRSGTLAVRDLNLRFEWRGGSGLPAAWFASEGPKFLIGQMSTTLGGSTNRRAIMLMGNVAGADNSAHNRSNTFTVAPGQNTIWGFGDQAYSESWPPNTFYVNGPQGVYWKDPASTGTVFNGRPLIPSTETVTIEFRVMSIANTGFPNGLIGFRIYRRNGEMFQRGIPWTADATPLGAYFNDFQMFGCGQHNFAVAAGTEIYCDVGGMITVARDQNRWLGPRAGFVTG